MFSKSCLFLFVLTIIRVSARYKNVELDHIVNKINSEPAEITSSSSRMVSGWEAQPGQHPHHATLRMVHTNGGFNIFGGSIISKEWVLSSGRCTINRVLAVICVGVVNINDNNPENIFETTEWYNHPRFNNLSTVVQSHGVTLLKLQRPVVYTRLVKRIRLQPSADMYRNYDGEQVYASGYGRISEPGSDVLRWLYLVAISNSACRTTTSSAVHTTTMCARYNVTTQFICFTDFGGPLVHVGSDGVPTLIGVSFYFPVSSLSCDLGWPLAFYRPGAFIPWFKEVTGIDFENLQEDDEDETTTTSTAPTTTTTTTSTITTTPSSTPVPMTTTTFSTTTDSYGQGPEDFTPEDNITATPEDSEEKEEDSDSSECNEDNDMAELMKRLEVNVKVKVAFSKYNITKEVGTDTSVSNH